MDGLILKVGHKFGEIKRFARQGVAETEVVKYKNLTYNAEN